MQEACSTDEKGQSQLSRQKILNGRDHRVYWQEKNEHTNLVKLPRLHTSQLTEHQAHLVFLTFHLGHAKNIFQFYVCKIFWYANFSWYLTLLAAVAIRKEFLLLCFLGPTVIRMPPAYIILESFCSFPYLNASAVGPRACLETMCHLQYLLPLPPRLGRCSVPVIT